MKLPQNLLLTACLTIICLGCSEARSTTLSPQYTASSEDQSLTETQRMNRWLDARYEESLSRHPIQLTLLGRKERYDEIDDFSEAAADEELLWLAATVDELKTKFSYAELSDDGRISYDLWIYQYESNKALAPFRRHEYIFTQMDGPQSSVADFLVNYHRVDNESDMLAYIARIGEMSRAILQGLDRAKAGAAEGVRPPRFAYAVVIEEARNLVVGIPFTKDGEQESVLWMDANAKIAALVESKSIDEATATKLRQATREALLRHFQPAYTQLITWFEADIENTSEEPLGVIALPDGEAFYNAMLAYRTTSALTANEIHEIGLKEVARIRAEMEAIKTAVGFDGTLASFFDFIRNAPQFYYSNDDAGRQRYIERTEQALSVINGKLPDYFGLLPKADLVVKRVEPFREQDGAAQHYRPGTPDGSRPGTYYLHLSDMTGLNTTELEAIAYHEGSPGHHLEISISRELEGIPVFRTQAFFNSFSEGWALYAETLAKEMGAYEDPYSDFGRLNGEMWRAIRLVVDTGIHARGWTEEQAVAYFMENSATPEITIISEVQRYFVWPAQAASYKIGMLKIQQLRAEAEAELGDNFDIRAFHDTVLGSGPLPEPILDRVVRSWMEEANSN